MKQEQNQEEIKAQFETGLTTNNQSFTRTGKMTAKLLQTTQNTPQNNHDIQIIKKRDVVSNA